MLCPMSQAIKTPKLLGNFRLYWFDVEFPKSSFITKIHVLDGVKEFRELISEVSTSIHNADRLWKNEFNKSSLFANIVKLAKTDRKLKGKRCCILKTSRFPE